jgi:hypothetical protein
LTRTALTAWVNAAGSAVFPPKTRTAAGQPSDPLSSSYSIWAVPFLLSREYPVSRPRVEAGEAPLAWPRQRGRPR